MVSEGKMKGAVMATSSTASASMELEQPDLDCPHCNVRLVQIKSKQVKTKGKIYVKCPFSVKDDLTTCRFIRSEQQYQVWAVKRREELAMAAKYSEEAASGEEDANLWHELNTLKQKVDSLVTEVSKLNKNRGVPVQEVEMRKWQTVVDFSLIATLLVGLVIGVFCAIIWK